MRAAPPRVAAPSPRSRLPRWARAACSTGEPSRADIEMVTGLPGVSVLRKLRGRTPRSRGPARALFFRAAPSSVPRGFGMSSTVTLDVRDHSSVRATRAPRHAAPRRRFLDARRKGRLAMLALVGSWASVPCCAPRVQRARAVPRRRVGRALLAGRNRHGLAHVVLCARDLLLAAHLRGPHAGHHRLAAAAPLRGRRRVYPRDVHTGALLRAGSSLPSPPRSW